MSNRSFVLSIVATVFGLFLYFGTVCWEHDHDVIRSGPVVVKELFDQRPKQFFFFGFEVSAAAGFVIFGIAIVILTIGLTGSLWHIYRRRKIRYRIAKGLCPTCGYDLRKSSKRCPECGFRVTEDKDSILPS